MKKLTDKINSQIAEAVIQAFAICPSEKSAIVNRLSKSPQERKDQK